MKKIIWAIAGLDTSGAAGIATDIKVAEYFAIHCCPIITSIVAQNNHAVIDLSSATTTDFSSQLSAVVSNFPPAAIKIGLVKSRPVMEILSTRLKNYDCPIVLDTVLETSSGYVIHDNHERQFFIEQLLPIATLITPNLVEAEILLNRKISTHKDIERAASDLLHIGAQQVLIKGGHLLDVIASDYWTDGRKKIWLRESRASVHKVRGTGCALATAIAANLAKNQSIEEVLQIAKKFISTAITSSKLFEADYHVLTMNENLVDV